VYPRPFLHRSEPAIKALEQRVMHPAGGTVADIGKPSVKTEGH